MNWVEKYRPALINEICSQSNIIDSLKNVFKNKNIPHLIFYGPSGCGKTSTILALAKELFGNYINDRIIELNASDERGINIIREKIKIYAKQSINTNNNLPPWKIIILDEADTMTQDSQFALRRIIEQYSNITRFCIICNYYHKIIEPIISRCSLFRFRPIKNEDIVLRLKYICEQEKIIISDNIINKISIISNNDLRKAINLLQKCSNIYDEKINENILNELSGVLSTESFSLLTNYISNKDIINIDKYVNNFFNESYSLINQINLLHNYIINLNISCDKKAKIMNILLVIDQNLIKGCDEYIQFMKLLYYMILII
jgi:replication factor C subunit 2/4